VALQALAHVVQQNLVYLELMVAGLSCF